MSQAELVAKRVLEESWDGELPVNPTAIAYDQGITVCYDISLKESGKFVMEDGKPCIKVNPFEPQVRQRFTIFHELGHYKLGHGESYRDPSKSYSRNNYDAKEAAANQFAAAMIMPDDVVRDAYHSARYSFSDLAELFDVSEAALSIKLERLGLPK